ncbi:hypothetical protein M422DRAFT_66550 [Sphaerobolus stellatus SS14]|nr:hypothetical protein M422DRAFT_66550 [Sphaerobolus stellatus SS14]
MYQNKQGYRALMPSQAGLLWYFLLNIMILMQRRFYLNRQAFSAGLQWSPTYFQVLKSMSTNNHSQNHSSGRGGNSRASSSRDPLEEAYGIPPRPISTAEHMYVETQEATRAMPQVKRFLYYDRNERTWICRQCPNQAGSQEQVIVHVYRDHFQIDRFRCVAPSCSFSTNWERAARRHYKESEEKTLCPRCGKALSRDYYSRNGHANGSGCTAPRDSRSY